MNILLSIIICLSAQPTNTWCGAYDGNPNHYNKTKKHSDTFVVLDETYSNDHNEYIACLSIGLLKQNRHYTHDHTYTVKNRTIYMTCWDMNWETKRVESVGKIVGKFNKDFTKLKMGGITFKKVSNKRSIPPQIGGVNGR